MSKSRNGARSCSAIVVVGLTCAGKTTLGQYLSRKHGFRHVEASTVLDLIRKRENPEADALDFAQDLIHRRGPDVVAAEVLRQNPSVLDGRFALTGFRLREEVELLRQFCPRIKTVLVEARQEIRLDRFLETRGNVFSEDKFYRKEKTDLGFGLLEEPRSGFDYVVSNNGSLRELHQTADKLVLTIDALAPPGC